MKSDGLGFKSCGSTQETHDLGHLVYPLSFSRPKKVDGNGTYPLGLWQLKAIMAGRRGPNNYGVWIQKNRFLLTHPFLHALCPSSSANGKPER